MGKVVFYKRNILTMSEERVKKIMKKVKKISKRKQLREIEKHLPKAYRPISGWGYFWRSVFYAIPVLGWLFVLINAIGAKNRNGRNFARSYFCAILMAIIVAVIGVAALAALYYAAPSVFASVKETVKGLIA